MTLWLVMAFAAPLATAQSVNVLTWHNDIGRTGQNTNETSLTTTNVVKSTFGKICSAQLDGKIHAQPLIVTGVQFNNQAAKTIAYVATENDSVYAVDATNCTILNTNGQPQSLLLAGETAANCHDTNDCTVGPTIGVLGTPTIKILSTNPTTGTLYAVAESECPHNTSQCGNNTSLPVFYHRLWALNITTLAPTNGNYVQICSSGCGGDPDGSTFAKTHYQRPGLLFLDNSKTILNRNIVYAAFSMTDNGTTDPNGWIFGYNGDNLADSSFPLLYETTDGLHGKKRGGIWQGGAGVAAGQDSNGSYYLYFSTSDGDFDLASGGTDASDSFIKLNTSLQYPSGGYYFTPSDQLWRQCKDFDYGSGGPLLLPDQLFTTKYAVKADKENYLWVIDRTTPGGFDVGNCNSYCSSCHSCNACPLNQQSNHNAESPIAFRTNHTGEPEVRSSPAFWSGSVSTGDVGELYFVAPGTNSQGQMYRYSVNANCIPGPVCQNPGNSTNVDPSGSGLGYASTPSISSNSSYQNGIVWVIKRDPNEIPPTLFAFDAGMLNELWDSLQCVTPSGVPRDQPGMATKFSVPTVANGYVYIGTETDFDIYGAVTLRSCGVGFGNP